MRTRTCILSLTIFAAANSAWGHGFLLSLDYDSSQNPASFSVASESAYLNEDQSTPGPNNLFLDEFASTPASSAVKSTSQWIADTASADAATRAAAITGLAEAPRAEALPVLGRILENGEPQVDRPLALISLRDLALNQGDADGAVRDAIRHVIYHGDDFTRVDEAQEALDVIEESLQRQ